jgi:hypothetical protein
MPNWKSRSDTEAWWSSQPGNRGKTFPGEDIASKQYERNKAAGENNLSLLKSFFKRPAKSSQVDLGDVSGFSKELPPLDKPRDEYKKDERGSVSLSEAKGGRIDLKKCKVSTHAKSKSQSNW